MAALWDNPYLFIGEEHNTAVGARRRNIHHTGSRVSCGNAVRDLRIWSQVFLQQMIINIK